MFDFLRNCHCYCTCRAENLLAGDLACRFRVAEFFEKRLSFDKLDDFGRRQNGRQDGEYNQKNTVHQLCPRAFIYRWKTAATQPAAARAEKAIAAEREGAFFAARAHF